MSLNSIFFACGPGAEIFLVIYGVLALWILSGVFFVANLCLLFALRDGHLLRHGSAILIYTLVGLVAYTQIEAGTPSLLPWLGGGLGLPPVVIGHFIWLVRLVRRERRALRCEPQPS